MHVVGHNDPCMQLVACSLKLQQHLLEHLGNLRFGKPALTVSSIKILLDLLGPLIFHDLFDLPQYRCGEAIGKAERNKVNSPFSLEVRQVTAIVDALCEGIGGRRVACATAQTPVRPQAELLHYLLAPCSHSKTSSMITASSRPRCAG